MQRGKTPLAEGFRVNKDSSIDPIRKVENRKGHRRQRCPIQDANDINLSLQKRGQNLHQGQCPNDE